MTGRVSNMAFHPPLYRAARRAARSDGGLRPAPDGIGTEVGDTVLEVGEREYYIHTYSVPHPQLLFSASG